MLEEFFGEILRVHTLPYSDPILLPLTIIGLCQVCLSHLLACLLTEPVDAAYRRYVVLSFLASVLLYACFCNLYFLYSVYLRAWFMCVYELYIWIWTILWVIYSYIWTVYIWLYGLYVTILHNSYIWIVYNYIYIQIAYLFVYMTCSASFF